MEQDKKLQVYIASAGAGKTHQLTGEYLRLALRAPRYFVHIQAVTFTNKATQEMKDRILTELSCLAHSPEKSPFISELSSIYQESIGKIQRRASLALQAILSDYSSLRVKTIDAFFQEVVRCFARELDLSGSYRVNMDIGQALRDGVTALLAEGDDGDKDLLRWLRDIAQEHLDGGKGQNLTESILNLARELEKESVRTLWFAGEYHDSGDRLPVRAELIEFRSRLLAYRSSVCDRAISNAQRVITGLQTLGLGMDDLSYGKDVLSPFVALLDEDAGKSHDKLELRFPTARGLRAMEDRESLWKKASGISTRDKVLEFHGVFFVPAVEEHIICSIYAQSIDTALSLYNSYGIISDIASKVRKLQRSEHAMLISDAPSFVSQILKLTDAPFIYERLGGLIAHQMIDEFQDTSHLQYGNFKVLLEENLSKAEDNLVVGDAKQSIYRWRNSDSRILLDHIGRDFSAYVHRRVLKDNWRSCRAIVEFNNALYPVFATGLSSLFSELVDRSSYIRWVDPKVKPALLEDCKIFAQYYADVEQSLPEGHRDMPGGVVVHRCLFASRMEDAVPGEEACEGSKFSEAQVESDGALRVDGYDHLSQLPYAILEIVKRGYRPCDIAILVRRKAEARSIADTLLRFVEEHEEVQFGVVSDEALHVNTSLSVRLLVAVLRYIRSRGQGSLEQCLVEELYAQCTLIQGDRVDIIAPDLEYFLSLEGYGLYELVTTLHDYHRDILPQEEVAYQIRFLDFVLQYQSEYRGSLADFLEYWDSKQDNVAISTPENDQSVRIMTIHKSKGLGFPVVLLPYLTWPLADKHRPMLWCRPEQQPFDQIGYLPVVSSNKLLDTIFVPDYIRECMLYALDELNLLYVATTRAKNELHLWLPDVVLAEEVSSSSEGQIDKKQLLPRDYNSSLHGTSKEWVCIARPVEELLSSGAVPYTSDIAVSDCRLPLPIACGSNRSEYDGGDLDIPSFTFSQVQSRISVLREGVGYFLEDSPQRFGRVRHAILEEIHTAEDIARAVANVEAKGWIASSKCLSIRAEIESLISDPLVARWFDAQAEILNEVSIVGQGLEGARRPDRVVLLPDGSVEVIDYKFGRKYGKYKEQVREYVRLLQAMGYERVRGYLWYVAKQSEIVQVD